MAALLVSEQSLERSNHLGDSGISEFFDTHLEAELTRHDEDSSLVARVRVQVSQSLSERIPMISDVASRLGLSGRTLQRRLSDRGHSFQSLGFSEVAFVDMVQMERITLPAAGTPEPFVDAGDIGEIAVAALTEPDHAGEIDEVTGPRLMAFADVARELSLPSGRDITHVPVPHDAFVAGARKSGAPRDVIWMLDHLFATVLDGRNAHLTDGVERALGRRPTDFTEYAREAYPQG